MIRFTFCYVRYAVTALSTIGFAATKTWIVGNGLWSDSVNWSGGVPGAGDAIVAHRNERPAVAAEDAAQDRHPLRLRVAKGRSPPRSDQLVPPVGQVDADGTAQVRRMTSRSGSPTMEASRR